MSKRSSLKRSRNQPAVLLITGLANLQCQKNQTFMQIRMVGMVESQERLLLPAAPVHLLRSKSVTGAQRVAIPFHFLADYRQAYFTRIRLTESYSPHQPTLLVRVVSHSARRSSCCVYDRQSERPHTRQCQPFGVHRQRYGGMNKR